ncbi:MAG: helix-turn-helix transcriptional regulator [Parvibaculaceae bacterium]
MIDRTGRIVHANDGWLGHDIGRLMPDTFVADLLAIPEGQRMLDRDWRLDWHGLADDFPLAPRGSLVMAQKASAAETDEAYAAVFDRFSRRHALTKREIDVAKLALLGLSSERIAHKLDLTPGSVRNHRSNVYSKLDVTSEREFFRSFLAEVLTKAAG